MITASHGDSPAFRLKTFGDSPAGEYTSIPVERYGGSLLYSWMDRPLELSGCAIVRTACGVESRLFRSADAVAMIPSVAIHMNRDANKNLTLDMARDMIPLFGDKNDRGGVHRLIVRLAGCGDDELVSYDATLSCLAEPVTFGESGKFIAAPRLDDLMCAYTMLDGFIRAEKSGDTGAVPVYCLYDGEEIGSRIREGADSDLLPSTLVKIASFLLPDMGDAGLRLMLSNSFLVSSDNAHAIHPNHPELDGGCRPVMNGGVTVKRSASRSYITDSISDGIVTEICRRTDVPCQHYSNRSDLPGGSTLGAIAVTGLPVLAADIGAPQLAMHSAVESCGEMDVSYMSDFARAFYSSRLEVEGSAVSITTL